MKIFNKNLAVAALVISFIFFLTGPTTVFAATTPNLGAAATFSALAHTFNNTTIPFGTAFYGDLGYATSSGAVYVSGATHLNDATYTQAGADQHTALSALNSQSCTFTFSGAVDLATDISHGALGVYTPGVYCSPGNMSIGGGGTVSLDGAGTYIFRPTGALTTTDFSIATTTNGASACDVFWTPQMPTPPLSTALGSDTKFVGTVIEPVGAANSNITVGGGTKWVGRALAYDWTVTTNPIILRYITITAPTCPVPPAPTTATLHVIKHVVNNDGGTAVASAFNLHVKGSGSMGGVADVAGSPAAGVETPGTSYTLDVGTYVISENTSVGYTATFSGDCDANGNVTLASGNNKTCTITNDDIAVPPPAHESATLHVIKIVVNDNGGKAIVSEAVIHVTNGTGDVSESPQAGAGSPGTSYTLDSGTYTVSEDFFPGYTVKIGGDCTDSGTVALASGDDKTCIITNNDIAGIIITTITPPTTVPPTSTPATCDICSLLTYDVYIINPDKSERHTGTGWVKVTDRGKGIQRYSFEDATLDPKNPLFDHNDSVVDVDLKDCKSTKFMFVSSDASWKHQVRIKVSIDGVTQSDTLVVNDSKTVVGTFKIVNATTGVNTKLACSKGSTATGLKGKILLQVQAHGEAWYVNPKDGKRYYMANGEKAYNAMRNFGVGITTKDLDKIKASKILAKKSSGKIFLQIELHGEAYYIDFNGTAHYLKDGAAAYEIMRSLGLGITNSNLDKISIGDK